MNHNYHNNNNYRNSHHYRYPRSNRRNTTLDTMNPAPRCPVILLLDISGSMEGDPIAELNAALCQFIQETSSDEAASMSVELEVITFSDTAKVALPFMPISTIHRNSASFTANGMTAMGAALALAERELRKRRNDYRYAGISSYRPWVILMSDGAPNDEWQVPAEKMRSLGESGRITYFGIEIGPGADHQTMSRILPANPGPVKLKDLRFKQFFRWLSDSLKSVSASAVSDQDNVKFGKISSWADLAGI